MTGSCGQVKTAVQDGYDLRGYHYWTLLDNFGEPTCLPNRPHVPPVTTLCPHVLSTQECHPCLFCMHYATDHSAATTVHTLKWALSPAFCTCLQSSALRVYCSCMLNML